VLRNIAEAEGRSSLERQKCQFIGEREDGHRNKGEDDPGLSELDEDAGIGF
jgi:hypothetical protein